MYQSWFETFVWGGRGVGSGVWIGDGDGFGGTDAAAHVARRLASSVAYRSPRPHSNDRKIGGC